jgi:hypothetical protein
MDNLNRDFCRTAWRAPIAALGIATALAWPGGASFAIGVAPQMTFASPQQAADALVAASRAGKTDDLKKILGPSGRRLIFSGDRVADQAGREKFVADYDAKHAIDTETDSKSVLLIGADEWPFPIPLVKQGDAWAFDTKAGKEEVLDRRIGRNELNAIEVCGAIVDAEHDYASQDRTGKGSLEYTQKFVSSPGQHDGLYWPAKPGEEESLIGPLVVSARAEGYGGKSHDGKGAPYHGYYYKILTQQGQDAPGGAYDYVVKGHMIGGFALVAFPAKFGDSGVMTFIVDKDGVIYEKNLGPHTKDIAAKMTMFDPDSSWTAHR